MPNSNSDSMGMNIGQMHVMFRQFAQQMGMQNIRAILPEQIDLLLNTSIGDITNQLVRSSVGITNDRIITDNSKIQQINSLRTLYKTQIVRITKGNHFSFYNRDKLSGKFEVDLDAYDNVVVTPAQPAVEPVYDEFDPTVIVTPGRDAVPAVYEKQRVFRDYLFLVDFSVNYVPVIPISVGIPSNGWYGTTTEIVEPAVINEDDFISNIYPIRLIDDAFLADTLNDFLLKPTLRSPVMTVVNNHCEIYFGKMNNIQDVGGSAGFTLKDNLVPYELRMSYIAKPARVEFNDDMPSESVDCDLPANLHIDVVKHAVELYSQIVGRGVNPQDTGTSQANTGESTTPQQRQ